MVGGHHVRREVDRAELVDLGAGDVGDRGQLGGQRTDVGSGLDARVGERSAAVAAVVDPGPLEHPRPGRTLGHELAQRAVHVDLRYVGGGHSAPSRPLLRPNFSTDRCTYWTRPMWIP